MPLTTLETDQHEARLEALQRRLDEKDAEISKLQAELKAARARRAIAAAAGARLPHITDATATPSTGPAAPEKPAAKASDKSNPFTKEHWNLTKQCELYARDRDLAERLSAEAGVPIAKP